MKTLTKPIVHYYPDCPDGRDTDLLATKSDEVQCEHCIHELHRFGIIR